MKRTILTTLALMVAGIAGAATVNIPSGLTGLWRFQNNANLAAATVGSDIMFSNAVYGAQFVGSSMDHIGGDGWESRYSDNLIFQESSWNYMAINPNFTANGGGNKVNQYTVVIDYRGDTGLNSIFQTARNGNATDGDLWIDGTTHTNATIGVDAVGFSSLTFDASKFHRIVWSVNNGNWFRVYVDGTNYLDGAGQSVDGRFSVYPDRLNLFADDSWQDKWGMVGAVMTWNRALTPEEIAAMGGWIGGSASPTPLVYNNTPELISVSPANGATNVPPDFAYQALIFDPVKLVNRTNVQLLLDGLPVTSVVTGPEASVFVKFSAGGLLRNGSTHKYTLIVSASGIYSTNETTFTVQNDPYTHYEWRFTQGDLAADLGNGVMSYADPSSTPGLTSFGTTDGSTVPHINGSPAKYMHLPGFPLDTDGYQLQFNDTGPNGGGAYINCYTLLFDMLVPSPWEAEYIVPYFNADPYNLSGNDADFYLQSNGSIGIGYTGYSATNVVKADTWSRVTFVADLAANTLTYYVNGTAVKSGAANGLEGRWSLYSNQDAGPDLFLFNEGDTSGVWTHELYVSSIAFTDKAMSAADLAALGGPSADGILVPSLTTQPTMAIRTSGGGATISWSTNSIGFALEQAESLTSPQWTPVSGITNNAVEVPTSSAARFFRLAK